MSLPLRVSVSRDDAIAPGQRTAVEKRDLPQRGLLVELRERRDRVDRHDDLKPPKRGAAGRVEDADVADGSGHDQGSDTPLPQLVVQGGSVKCVVAQLADN